VKRALSIFKILAICIALVTLHLSVPSSAVEFGQDATGDPNAVKVGGASGFLYSERIIFTAAHVVGGYPDAGETERQKNISRWEREGVIYNPGIVSVVGQKYYKVKQIIVPSTYVPYADYPRNIQPVDDFAIIILSEDIPVTKKVMIASEEQMQRFVKEKSTVEMIGYGIQNGGQRNRPWEEIINRSPSKLTSVLSSPEMVVQFYKQYPDGLPSWWKTKDGIYGVVQDRTKTSGAGCDGDSGSGYFVEENDVRYYFGNSGMGLFYNNCPPPVKPFRAPSMSWITPAYRFLDLIKTAEEIVAEDKRKEFAIAEEARLAAELKRKQEAEAKAKAEAEARARADAEAKAKAEEEARVKAEAELKAKQEAEVKAAAEKKKTTITCTKGKLTKKVSAVNPKCPKGYTKR
jgi:hypothetical protein